MTDRFRTPRLAALHDLERSFRDHCSGKAAQEAPRRRSRRLAAALRHRTLRRALLAVAGLFLIAALGAGGLWLRLSAGPLSLDFATPILASAIEHTIGSRHRVEIGGTQIERDNQGRAAVRIRDMLIRDADGAVIASAPKAEVAVSMVALMTGDLRAKRVSLVGAELAIRIENDGQVTISTGADRRPIAITPTIVRPAQGAAAAPSVGAQASAPPLRLPTGGENFSALMRWIDATARPDSDSEILGEVGLKDGSLTVDDQRNGKTWTFEHISFSLNRLPRGGVVLSLGSENEERPWKMTAAVVPLGNERRLLQVEARKVATRDLLLAMRLDEGQFQADVPISGAVRAEIGPDFRPVTVEGRLVAEAGMVGNPNNPDGSFRIDSAEVSLDWDQARRTLIAPFKIAAEKNRITMMSQFDAPIEPGAPWRITATGGSIVLGAREPGETPLVLNRILMRGAFDYAGARITLSQGEIAGGGVNLAMSGTLDFSSGEPVISGGMAGTPMKGALAKRIWPVFVAAKVRNWVLANIHEGEIARMELAANAPVETLKEDGPPIPNDGLSVEIDVAKAVLRPVDGLPPIRDADLTTRIKGRHVVISVGRGTVELESGRKLTITNGTFEVPDTHPKSPPARAQFKIEGPVAAAAELVALDRLREASNAPLDPATSRGNVVGQISVGLPITRDPPKGSINYNIGIDVTNFVAERMMLNQKVEAQLLKISANAQGFQIKGDVRLNGTPAVLDYRKLRDQPDTEVRLQMTLDDAARARFGFDAGPALSGPVPVRLAGRIANNRDSRFNVEADLTQAKIENLLPGWIKAPGKANRAAFMVIHKDKATIFENVVIDGSGASVKGQAELDANGDLVSAHFPVFALSDGDKTALRAERGNEGVLRLSMRGDVYDGRNFVKSVFGQSGEQKSKRQFGDLDLDIKLGAVAGYNGEALRGVDLKLSRRAGQIRMLSFTSKIGRDTQLTGELRGAARGRQVLYFETDDAGALFRFTDNYARMNGGQMWVAIDPPTADQAAQEGLLNIRDFMIKGEPNLDRVVGAANAGGKGVVFTRMRVEFTRTPGKLAVREGIVRGPAIGATMDGLIDFAKNDVRLRGTFVPLYGLNNAFGQIPIVGLFLGGSNEGLLGITYEVSGAPNAPVLRVNPISAIAPGLLRKFFEFPNVNTGAPQVDPSVTSSADPSR